MRLTRFDIKKSKESELPDYNLHSKQNFHKLFKRNEKVENSEHKFFFNKSSQFQNNRLFFLEKVDNIEQNFAIDKTQMINFNEVSSSIV